MNIGCTAATPSVGGAVSSTTPPLGTAASTAAHFRLGRTSRRSSSSGSSSSSNGGVGGIGNAAAAAAAAVGTASQGAGASRKRRRHSTLSSGIASGSEEEGERAPPMFRLRLGSYVSDFRLARTRSSSPNNPHLSQATPSSPPSALRQRHQLRIQTTVEVESLASASASPPPQPPSGESVQRSDRGIVAAASFSPTSSSSSSVLPQQRDSDVDMDLDVQSTFQAMQVDSPTASPSPTVPSSNGVSFFPSTTTTSSLQRPSPIPSSLLSPIITDTRYPRSPSPLSASSSAYPSFPASISHVTNPSVSPSVFPSASLLAARRTSRHQHSLTTVPPQQQHMPASSSPLARILSFDASLSAPTHTQPQEQQQQRQQHLSALHPHFDSFPSASFSQQPPSVAQFQAPSQRGSARRRTSTPPSPVVASQEAAGGPSAGDMVPPSPLRRYSDGRPSGFKLPL